MIRAEYIQKPLFFYSRADSSAPQNYDYSFEQLVRIIYGSMDYLYDLRYIFLCFLLPVT